MRKTINGDACISDWQVTQLSQRTAGAVVLAVAARVGCNPRRRTRTSLANATSQTPFGHGCVAVISILR